MLPKYVFFQVFSSIFHFIFTVLCCFHLQTFVLIRKALGGGGSDYCHPTCLTCSVNDSRQHCSLCRWPLDYFSNCPDCPGCMVDAGCPNGYRKNTLEECLPCEVGCSVCFGPAANQCVMCDRLDEYNTTNYPEL